MKAGVLPHRSSCFLISVAPNYHDNGATHDHTETEKLSHGKWPENEAQLRIGLPHEFNKKPYQAISDEIETKMKSGREFSFS